MQSGISENWSFAYREGTFYLDGRPTGMILGSKGSIRFILIVLAYLIFRSYRQGKFSRA